MARPSFSFLSLAFGCALATAAWAQADPESPASTGPPELTALQSNWTELRTQQLALADQRRAQARSAYLLGLEMMEKQLMQKGDLEGVLAIRTEKAQANVDQPITTEIPKGAPPELAAWRAKYEVSRRSISDEWLKTDDAARQKYVGELQSLQIALTRKGQVDAALAVKAERDKQVASAPSVPVKPTPATTSADSKPSNSVGLFGIPLDPGGSSRPATSSSASASADWIVQITTGAWILRDSGGAFAFEPGGDTHNTWNRERGTWKVTGPLTVEFTMDASDGFMRQGRFSPDLKTLTYEGPKGTKTVDFKTR